MYRVRADGVPTQPSLLSTRRPQAWYTYAKPINKREAASGRHIGDRMSIICAESAPFAQRAVSSSRCLKSLQCLRAPRGVCVLDAACGARATHCGTDGTVRACPGEQSAFCDIDGRCIAALRAEPTSVAFSGRSPAVATIMRRAPFRSRRRAPDVGGQAVVGEERARASDETFRYGDESDGARCRARRERLRDEAARIDASGDTGRDDVRIGRACAQHDANAVRRVWDGVERRFDALSSTTTTAVGDTPSTTLLTLTCASRRTASSTSSRSAQRRLVSSLTTCCALNPLRR